MDSCDTTTSTQSGDTRYLRASLGRSRPRRRASQPIPQNERCARNSASSVSALSSRGSHEHDGVSSKLAIRLLSIIESAPDSDHVELAARHGSGTIAVRAGLAGGKSERV